MANLSLGTFLTMQANSVPCETGAGYGTAFTFGYVALVMQTYAGLPNLTGEGQVRVEFWPGDLDEAAL